MTVISESHSGQATADQDVRSWLRTIGFKDTSKIRVPERLIDQVIGQDEAVEVVRKGADQRRHLMLLGDPGTGKSMLARAMAELLPPEELEDLLAYPNLEDPNQPRIKVVPGGKGKDILEKAKEEARLRKAQKNWVKIALIGGILLIGVIGFLLNPANGPMWLFFAIIAAAMVYIAMRQVMPKTETELVPKLLIHHETGEKPPFEDATGAHAGALLGDVKHDPFQSGGLETPAHERVEVGAIHKAHKGVLFIDEINLLRPESQQALLTALQEKQFPIMGQSERSSGAMVKSEPAPCDFILVAAGNLDSIKGMHPALRSRIRGYGYEVYVRSDMPDTPSNREKLLRFIAQEVKKDGKIPHFALDGAAEILVEAQRRAGRKGKLSLRLRELGGLIRAAGDVAKEEGSPLVRAAHVQGAKAIARSLEQQIADRMIERLKEYKALLTHGAAVGRVNGLAVLNGESGMNEYSGVVLNVVAEITPAQSREEGRIIATGRLGEIAKEAVSNVSALIKKHTGQDVTSHDIHIQFLDTYEGVEGDSASVSVATAVISAFEGIPVDQSVAMTGSLSVRGDVLPVGGVSAKIEAAIEAGLRTVLIPRANLKDVVLSRGKAKRIRIVPVSTLSEVLSEALVPSSGKEGIMHRFTNALSVGMPGPLPSGGPVAILPRA